jgi:hypothetical protein
MAGILIFGLYNYIRCTFYSLQCKNWPSTKGTIILTPHAHEQYEHTYAHRGEKTGYNIHLLYEYEVDGEKYEGNTISFKLSVVTNQSVASHLVSMYEKGEIVDVYYHPRKHNISTLNIK